MKKNIQVLIMSLALFSGLLAVNSQAQAATTANLWSGDSTTVNAATIQTSAGLGNTDPRAVISNVIRVVLGFLGIIAVIIILMGGFKYMTAQGDEKKVESAIGMMKTGVIGLIIILAAFGIANFVITALSSAV